ncbi:MAG: hypothetical protein ACP5QJ_07530, partial [Thermosulfidibacteraceae bacterium]
MLRKLLLVTFLGVGLVLPFHGLYCDVVGKIAPGVVLSAKQETEDIYVRHSLEFSSKVEEEMDRLLGVCDFSISLTNASDNSVVFGVRRLYGRYEGEFYSFLIGKSRIKNSVGYAWTPADIINPTQSLLYRDEERRGATVGTFAIGASLFYSFDAFPLNLRGSIYVLPQFMDVLTNLKGVGMINLDLFSIELLFSYGFYVSGEKRDSIYAGYVRSSIPGVDFLHFYTEFCNVNFSTNRQYLAGIQVNPDFDFIPGNLQFQGEYFYNQDGYRTMDDFRSKESLSLGIVRVPGLTLQNYFYIGTVYL